MTSDPLHGLKGTPYFVMDGAGNDFVILDLRAGGSLTPAAARHFGDRSGAFGCDQIITILPGPAMGIFNADGTRAGACGNAARCVAALLMEESGQDRTAFGSPSGNLAATRAEGALIAVNMGAPGLGWQDIPLAEPAETTDAVPLGGGILEAHGLPAPSCVSMGNPHAIFFVRDAETASIEAFGPAIEHHPAFPDRVNVTAASQTKEGLRTRTWERGVGMTKACGTAACAALVAAYRRGITGRAAAIAADGGILKIRWDEESGDVLMAGPVRLSRKGTL